MRSMQQRSVQMRQHESMSSTLLRLRFEQGPSKNGRKQRKSFSANMIALTFALVDNEFMMRDLQEIVFLL